VSGLLIAAFLCLVVVCMLHGFAERRRRDANLAELAARPGHERKPAGWFDNAEVFLLQVEGHPATLEFEEGDSASGSHTELQVEWQPPGVLRLGPESLWGSLRKLFGAQDLEFGDRTFDDAFVVQGEPEDWIRQLLDAETRELVLALRRISGELTVSVGATGVFLRSHTDLSARLDNLDVFLELSRELFRRLRASAGERLRISVQAVVGAGKCPVCSDDEGNLDRRCPSCETAYHPECWDYLGRCALLGCGGGRPARRERQLDW